MAGPPRAPAVLASGPSAAACVRQAPRRDAWLWWVARTFQEFLDPVFSRVFRKSGYRFAIRIRVSCGRCRKSYYGDSRGLAVVDAIAAPHDGCATLLPPRSGIRGLRCAAPCRLFLLVARLEEIDADLVAIDPGQFAAAIGKPGGRQQQEEFLEMQTLDGTFDREFRAGFRNVFHRAFAPPGAVDAHHMRGYPALECDSLALAPFCHHGFAPALDRAQHAKAGLCFQIKAKVVNKS